MKFILAGVAAAALLAIVPASASAQCAVNDARCNAAVECFVPGTTAGRWQTHNACADPTREIGTPCIAYNVGTGEQVVVPCEEPAPAP